MAYWLWGFAAVAAGVIAAEWLLRLCLLNVALPIFERRPPFNVQPTPPDPRGEPIEFPTTDGLTLRGSLHRPPGQPRGVIIFCPEFEGSHWSVRRYAFALLEAGYALLAFDFRNQGESDPREGYSPCHWLTGGEVADARAAVRFVGERTEFRGLPLGMFGISRGANAALAAAAAEPAVRAVACEGAFSTDVLATHYARRWAELYLPERLMRLVPDWHVAGTMRFVRRVSQIRNGVRYRVLEKALPKLSGRPVLLISGSRDSYVPPATAEGLRAKIGESARLWVVQGAKHNAARAAAEAEYDRRLVEHFRGDAPSSVATNDHSRVPAELARRKHFQPNTVDRA